MISEGQLVHATILCSDLGEYTAFSERTSPETLSQLMHAYFKTLFKPVQESGRLISDLAGDSMMALWATKEPTVSSRYRACESAMRINATLPEFWKKSDFQVHLPTRIGIHYGQVRLGNVGAGSHYQYKATGDAVNTAARIKNPNKHLQTRILASTDALHGVSDFLTRKAGRFLLSGKSTPIGITELMTRMETATHDQKYLVQMFTNGLSAYLDRSWNTALDIFNQILKRFPADGPTLFFANQCRHLRSSPPDSAWDGVVIVPKK